MPEVLLILVLIWLVVAAPMSALAKRLGFSGWWALPTVFPIWTIGLLTYFAFAKWPREAFEPAAIGSADPGIASQAAAAKPREAATRSSASAGVEAAVGSSLPPVVAAEQDAGSLEMRLQRVAKLHADGLISNEEMSARRAEILREI